MFKSIVILSVSLLASVMGASLPVGLEPRIEGRIDGGTTAKMPDHPYAVSVQRFGFHICGGAIFRNDLILTSAQCLQRVTPSSMRIRAGSPTWNLGGTIVNVLTYKVHEHYDPSTMENDIALIRLYSPLNFVANISSIAFALYPQSSSGFGTVVGWGTNRYQNNGNVLSDTLLQTDMTILSKSDCASSKYGYGVNIVGPMLCAIGNYGPSACDGDVGAPLVSAGKLVGLYSWGYGCSSSFYPSVYADVSALSSWILQTANFI